MLVPISWLKEYVDIKLPLKELIWKMTEIGMTTESYQKVGDDVVLDVEVTPNRPDWMSIVGIAREIGALQGLDIKFPKITQPKVSKESLDFKIKNDFELCPRYSAITIKGVVQKPSPSWMQERLTKVGLRPINNLVDVTNYVMFELGNPIHVFDYDKLKDGKMSIMKSLGKEKFISVDEKEYILPPNAIIFKSGGEVIDLCGIKGGQNSGITSSTKNVLILVAVYDGVLVRRTSQKLSLASEASRIFERGANTGGTIKTLNRTTNLMQKLAGGRVASKVVDDKKEKFEPWKLELTLERLSKILGITIPDKNVVEILKRLDLSPKINGKKITCVIPTYRGDLKIEEDLIEEVARLYGYNNFPKTLPSGVVSSTKVSYFYDRTFENEIKILMTGSGYTEAITLSLISSDLIDKSQLTHDAHIKISNPVSNEYEYMRTTLIPNLLSALKLNSTEESLKIFEYGKVYLDFPEDTKEVYKLGCVEKNTNFRSLKGTIDLIFEKLEIRDYEIKESIFDKGLWHPIKSGVIEQRNMFLGTFGEIHPKVLSNLGVKGSILAFELDVAALKKLREIKTVSEVPKFPPQVEDITLTLLQRTKVGEIIKYVKDNFNLVSLIELKDIYKDAYTFRVWFQKLTATLTNDEVDTTRKELLKSLKKEFSAVQKK